MRIRLKLPKKSAIRKYGTLPKGVGVDWQVSIIAKCGDRSFLSLGVVPTLGAAIQTPVRKRTKDNTSESRSPPLVRGTSALRDRDSSPSRVGSATCEIPDNPSTMGKYQDDALLRGL